MILSDMGRHVSEFSNARSGNNDRGEEGLFVPSEMLNEDIQNLFMMTPYYYKTAREDQEKLKHIEKLDVTTQFRTVIYNKSRSC